ncbi:hypothetical protein [Kaarinaea lacus]
MLVNAPVFSDENGVVNISMYAEDEDGSFRRTHGEPLRLLRDDIKGISVAQGELISGPYDRQERVWDTATITFHYGRPQSYFHFLRENVARNRFFVFTKPVLAGHLTKFSMHELQLKPSTSQRKIAILKEKYTEALSLWSQEEYSNHQQEAVNQAAIAKQQSNVVKLPQKAQQDKAKLQAKVQAQAQAQSRSPASSPQTNRQAPADAGQRNNLIKNFSLKKKESTASAGLQKERNKHFLKRFLFTID